MCSLYRILCDGEKAHLKVLLIFFFLLLNKTLDLIVLDLELCLEKIEETPLHLLPTQVRMLTSMCDVSFQN